MSLLYRLVESGAVGTVAATVTMAGCLIIDKLSKRIDAKTANSLQSRPAKPTTYRVEVELADDYVVDLDEMRNKMKDEALQEQVKKVSFIKKYTDELDNIGDLTDLKLIYSHSQSKNKLILSVQNTTNGYCTKVVFLMYLAQKSIGKNFKNVRGYYDGWSGGYQLNPTS